MEQIKAVATVKTTKAGETVYHYAVALPAMTADDGEEMAAVESTRKTDNKYSHVVLWNSKRGVPVVCGYTNDAAGYIARTLSEDNRLRKMYKKEPLTAADHCLRAVAIEFVEAPVKAPKTAKAKAEAAPVIEAAPAIEETPAPVALEAAPVAPVVPTAAEANLDGFVVEIDRTTGVCFISGGKYNAEKALTIIHRNDWWLRNIGEDVLDLIATVNNSDIHGREFKEAAYQLLKICQPEEQAAAAIATTDEEESVLRQLSYVHGFTSTPEETPEPNVEKLIRAAFLNGRQRGRTAGKE